MKNNINESELIHALKQGSRNAFNTIYSMYSKRLYAYCLQLTKSKEDSEEIVQDVFVRLWTNREKIKNEETVRSLLYIMAKHRFLDVYHSTVNSPVYEEYVNYCDIQSTEKADQSLEYSEFEKMICTCLDKLPVTQQKVVKLSKLEDLSNNEIVERLSLSEQTVKNQLSLGLKILRNELNKILFSALLLCLNSLFLLGTFLLIESHYL